MMVVLHGMPFVLPAVRQGTVASEKEALPAVVAVDIGGSSIGGALQVLQPNRVDDAVELTAKGASVVGEKTNCQDAQQFEALYKKVLLEYYTLALQAGVPIQNIVVNMGPPVLM
jgi:hypothetical protein